MKNLSSRRPIFLSRAQRRRASIIRFLLSIPLPAWCVAGILIGSAARYLTGGAA